MSRRGERREQILTAALRVIARHGMRKTTMEDIAEAAHMRAASLYYYFKNKEEVFSAAMRALGERYLSEVRQAVEAESTGRQRLLVYMKKRQAAEEEAGANFNISNEIMIELMPLVHAAISDVIEADFEFVLQILQQGIDDGSFEIADVERTATTLQACLMGVNLSCKTGNFDDTVVIPSLHELLVRGLLKHPSGEHEPEGGR